MRPWISKRKVHSRNQTGILVISRSKKGVWYHYLKEHVDNAIKTIESYLAKYGEIEGFKTVKFPIYLILLTKCDISEELNE